LQCKTPTDNDTITKIDNLFEQIAGTTGDQKKNITNAVYAAFSPWTGGYKIWPFDAKNQPIYTTNTNETSWYFFIGDCITGPQNCSFSTAAISGRPQYSDSDKGYHGIGPLVYSSSALWLRLGTDRLSCSIQRTNYTVKFDAANVQSSLANYTFEWQGVFNASTPKGPDPQLSNFFRQTQSVLDIFEGAVYCNNSWCALNCGAPGSGTCSSTMIPTTARTTIANTAAAGLLSPVVVALHGMLVQHLMVA
jgi:hypothetical protein